MTLQLDRSRGGTVLGEVELNMGDYIYGQYKYRSLNLVKSDANDVVDFNPEETILEIGLKGTRQEGLYQKRMSEVKKQMDSSIREVMKSSFHSSAKDVENNIKQGVQNQEMF